MFKRRARPASVRDRNAEASGSSAPLDSPLVSGSASPAAPPSIGSPALPALGPVAGSSSAAQEEDDTAQTVEEMIMLRKLRRAKQGIELEKLNKGDKRANNKLELGASEKFGLSSNKKRADGDDEEFEDEASRVKRLIRTNNFTQQTNALDVDKHMLAYIETEMAKRKGQLAADPAAAKDFDPQAELFRLAEKYEWDQQAIKDDEDGNVTNSLGMLTSIPEFDLGMENRLRNIEATEKAKREMMEARNAAGNGRRKPEDLDYSSARYHKGLLRVASDVYAANDEARQAAGLPPPSRPRNRDAHEQATDEQVYDRFRKRMKR